MKRDDLLDQMKYFMHFHQNYVTAENMLYFIENVLMKLQPFKVTNMDCECGCKGEEHLVELDLK